MLFRLNFFGRDKRTESKSNVVCGFLNNVKATKYPADKLIHLN